MYIHTIGYQGLNQTQVIQRLCQVGIRQLVDVRELPLSRKPGLSKTAIREVLAAHRIGYLHLRALGCPRDIRHAYRQDGHWDRYQSRYLDHLAKQMDALGELVQLVRNQEVCLFCFEADAAHCHRSLIVERVCEQMGEGLIVRHLVGAIGPDLGQVAALEVAAL